MINTIHSLKIFRNKIAHQIPVSLKEFYRFVDDTQIIIESLNIIDKNEIIKIENTRKEIIKRMSVTDDNKIIIGSNYNAGNNNIKNDLNLNKNSKYNSDSDIEMGDYDDDKFIKDYIDNINGKNYNDFNQMNNVRNNIKERKDNISEEEERKRKIDKNFEEIMKNNNNNFMTVKKIEF